MTTVALPTEPLLRDAFIGRVVVLLRVPSGVDATSMTFDPDLTVDEQATVALALDQVKSEIGLTAAAYADIRAQMQVLRALRQLGRNAFMALSATERDRQLYDAMTAVTQVFIAMTRDA